MKRPSRFRSYPFLALLGYYLVVTGMLALAVQLVPQLRELLVLDAAPGAGVTPTVGVASQPPLSLFPALGPTIDTVFVALFAMIGGLVFAFPVAWTYTVTKQAEGYDKSVVQLIAILPIAVAGVVMVVFGDLALAFALAGIVAAVRFRTTFKDVKDAVFAFVAIGIGLAVGIQVWILAGVLSLVFNIVILTLWRFELGEATALPARSSAPASLSATLAPGDTRAPLSLGDSELLAPLSSTEREQLRPSVARLEHHVKADAIREKQKYRELLLVYATDPAEVEEQLEELLPEYARRWQLVESFAARKGTHVMEYLVRLKKTADVAQMLERIRGLEGDLVRAIELRSIKGLRDLLG